MPVERTARSRGVSTLLALVVLGSLAARMQQLSRGLWLDEAWVANSVLSDTWRGMFYYDAWYQTTPAGFLAISRLLLSVLPLANASFRLIPIAFGIVGAVAFAALCRRALPGPLAVIAAAAFAFSPTAVTYSQEFKQYADDTAAAAIILLAAWLYMELPERRRFLWLTAACAAAIPFSYASVMVVPSAFFAIWAAGKNRWRRLVACALATGSSGSACYLLFIRPNSSPVLTWFWRDYFPSLASLPSSLVLLMDLLPGTPSLSKVRTAFGLAVLIAGAATVAFRRGCATNYRRLLAMAYLPALALAACGLLRLYPTGHVRLDVFMLGPVVLALAASAGVIWQRWLPAVRLPRFNSRWLGIGGGAAIVLLSGFYVARMNHRNYEVWHDAEGALRLIRDHAQPGDLVYFHATISEQAKLYSRVWNWHHEPAVMGNTGWPCCPPGKWQDWQTTDSRYVVRNFERQVPSRTVGRIWLAFAPAWGFLHRNESELIRGVLLQRGCFETPQPAFHKADARLFTCTQADPPATMSYSSFLQGKSR